MLRALSRVRESFVRIPISPFHKYRDFASDPEAPARRVSISQSQDHLRNLSAQNMLYNVNNINNAHPPSPFQAQLILGFPTHSLALLSPLTGPKEVSGI